MKRELKVNEILTRFVIAAKVTKPIPMKRELKDVFQTFVAYSPFRHKANPDEKGTESLAREAPVRGEGRESQSQSR